MQLEFNMIHESNCTKRGCIHYIGVESDGLEKNERHTCAAFPNGIPDVIAFGNNKHLKPYPGDNGIQYERESRDEKETKGSR